MSLKTFDWPYHTITINYPQRGSQVKLGGNWTYATKPNAPMMRNIQLNFAMLQWFRNEAGQLSSLVEPELNLMRLEEFYLEHELYKDFIYPHELYGNLIVRFSQPIVIPSAMGSDGVVPNIVVQLVEQPT